MRTRPESTVLAVIDVQQRLVPAIPGAAPVLDRICRLADGAGLLGVRRLLTEQYPKGLGPTDPEVAGRMPRAIEKLAFSCCGSDAFLASLEEPAAADGATVESVVLAGVETHVCILQTAVDLLARGFGVFVPVDAVASRHRIDHDTALRRLEGSGAILTTSESLLFEWCRSADHPRFQELRKVVLREGPTEPAPGA
jgi:nicotinamidase-related amidase